MKAKAVGRFFPQWLKQLYFTWGERYLRDEIIKLDIQGSDVDSDGMPWVELRDGTRFHGFFPDQHLQHLFRTVKSSMPNVKEECFGVVYEIVSRYLAPRSLPGETFLNPSRYRPLRDPLNDFHLSQDKKNAIAQRFRPGKGETFIDVGAFWGYGTMRIARMVGPGGNVLAVESDPDVLSVLRKNIVYNNLKQVDIVPKAASNHTGQSDFFSLGNTANSLQERVLIDQCQEKPQHTLVEVDTVDNMLPSRGTIKTLFVNITINGGEPEALLGMQQTLSEMEQACLTLAGWYRRDNTKICDIVEPELQKMGFTVIKGKLGRTLAWK